VDGGDAVGDDEGGAAAHEFLHRDMIAASVVGSRALVGSSSRRIGAFFKKARAMPMRWRWPTLRWPPRSPTWDL